MDATPAPRPYFFPENLDYETLPEPLKLAITALIDPLYQELVLQAADPLERAAGSSLACLMMIELLDQFDLGLIVNASGPQDREAHDRREQAVSRYLRLVGSKQKVTDLILRIRNYRDKQGPLATRFARG